MAKTATVPVLTGDMDERKYVRLTPEQVQLFADRFSANRSLTVDKLCRSVKISRSTFYFVTRGKFRTTPAKIRAIAEQIGIDPKEIFPV